MNISDTVVVGCKLLREDGSSLCEEGRVQYLLGEWIDVPGNGAYVAITGGLRVGGEGPLLAYFECDKPTGVAAPKGVVCYRHVRRLPDGCPERISPELQVALNLPLPAGLTSIGGHSVARENEISQR